MAKHPGAVEIFYAGVWNAVTARDADQITVTRDEQAEIITSRLSCTLDDRTLANNPANPLSPLYGLVGRNTPIRVTVDAGLRFYGEIASYRPRRTVDFDPVTGQGDAWVEIEATGVTRRLGQGKPPARSPVRRAVMSPAHTGLLAYWPCEDAEHAQLAGSALAGQPAMTASGSVDFAALDLQTFSAPFRIGSQPVPDLSGGASLTGAVPPGVSSPVEWSVQFAAGANTIPGASHVLAEWTTGGTYVRWTVQQITGAGTTDVVVYDAAGTATTILSAPGWSTGTTLHRVDAKQNGANVDVRLWFAFAYQDTATLAGVTLGRGSSFTANPNRVSHADPIGIGHVMVWDDYDAPGFDGPITFVADLADDPWWSFYGERFDTRLARLCAEEGVPLTMPAVSADFAAAMGAQPAAAFLDLSREAARTDDGILYEPRDALGYAYRPREDLYNQAPALTLDRAVPHRIHAPLEPAVDDDGVRNDVSVKRTIGSSARKVLDVGPLSTQAPPAGVGVVDTEIEVNLADDARLPDFAGWHLRKGTVEATRYESVTVDLDANPGLAAAVAAVDIGDVIELVNTEEGGALLLVRGYTEVVESFARRITFRGPPAQPWTVAQVDGTPRPAADGSTLGGALSSSGLSFQIVSTVENGPWSTDAADYPSDVAIGGERITLSSVTGASSPQTANVSQRAVNGIVKAHPAGAVVDVWDPAYLAL